MRFSRCIVFFFLFSTTVQAQQNHFIYLQAENKQAFYVKLEEKIFSSSASGYLIIPKLINGPYKLLIGFPKNEWPLQAMDIVITEKDQGYLLKNFGPKSWGLFNLQTMDVMMGRDMSANADAPVIENKTDAFSNTLAEVTNTPSIRQQEVGVGSKGNTDSTRPATTGESKREWPWIASPQIKISKVFSMIDNSGRSAIYTIDDGNKNDSVRIFIPYDDSKESTAPVIEKKNTNVSVSADSSEKKNNRAQSSDNEIQNTATVNVKPADSNAVNVKITILNPACKLTATDDDYSKLLKKMTAAGKEEDMVTTARRAFRSKCYTTSQVKNLSMLLVKDEWKYIFYDAAYDHVIDIGNFKDLQSQLTDAYYINRFKAMLR